MKKKYIILLAIAVGMAFMACQSAEMTAARVYIQQKDYSNALEQLRIASEKEPTNPEVFLVKGKLYAEMDSIEQMNDAFDTALELDSTKIRDIQDWRFDKRVEHFNRGIRFGDNKQWDKARDATLTAVNIDPTFTDGWVNLAYFYEKLEEEEKSNEAYRKAYELEPLNMDYAKNVAVREFNAGNAEEAEKILGKIIEEGEPDVDVYSLQGRVLMQQGKLDAAKELYDKALEDNPEDADLLFDYGALLFSTKENYDEAADYFKRVIEIDPDNTDALYNLTLALYQAENYEQAASWGEKLVANDPQNNLGWIQFAISLKRSGDAQKGNAAEKVVLALDAMESNDYDGAVGHLNTVTSQYPKWCAPWALLKIAYNEMGDDAGIEKAQAGLDACGE
ncbi:MAG: tetratricopeptide repeat protein [bacterium]